MTSEIIDTA